MWHRVSWPKAFHWFQLGKSPSPRILSAFMTWWSFRSSALRGGRNFHGQIFLTFYGKRWAWERPFNFSKPTARYLYIYTWKLKTNTLLPDFSLPTKGSYEIQNGSGRFQTKGPRPLVFELKLSHLARFFAATWWPTPRHTQNLENEMFAGGTSSETFLIGKVNHENISKLGKSTRVFVGKASFLIRKYISFQTFGHKVWDPPGSSSKLNQSKMGVSKLRTQTITEGVDFNWETCVWIFRHTHTNIYVCI